MVKLVKVFIRVFFFAAGRGAEKSLIDRLENTFGTSINCLNTLQPTQSEIPYKALTRASSLKRVSFKTQKCACSLQNIKLSNYPIFSVCISHNLC